jgi:hypothetical protein
MTSEFEVSGAWRVPQSTTVKTSSRCSAVGKARIKGRLAAATLVHKYLSFFNLILY